MASVQIRVLGPVVAEVDGREVALGGPQQRATLAALVMAAGSVVGLDGLVDRLWPDDPPASATKLVQKYVSGLRSALGNQAIETAGGGYRLTVEPPSIDVAAFESALTHPEEVTADDDLEILGVDGGWRGPPYSGCGELPFIVVERERLNHVRLQVQLDHLEAGLDRGRPLGPALASLERLAGEHPDHERISALLMRGLYTSDRQAEALREFQRIRRHLGDELGVDPSPDLQELELRILRHDESLRPTPAPGSIDRAEAEVIHDTASDDTAADETVAVEAEADAAATRAIEEIRPVVAVVVSEPSPAEAPEDLRAHHRDLADDVARVAARWGVEVERAVADEVVVVFGVPARESDPERAADLGRAIAEVRPAARVVVVADDALVAVSPHVALVAGRLLDRARSLIRTAAPGRPHLAPEVQALLAVVGQDADADDAPFIGRQEEVRAIDGVWSRVMLDGRLRVLEAIGDAGIGKSRLVREAVAKLDPPPARVIELEFSPVGDGALFAALRNALTQLFAGFDDLDGWLRTLDISDRVRKRLAAQLGSILAPESAPPPTHDGPDEWISPIVQLYDLVAAEGPMVVVVEDLHWGRPEAIAQLNDAMVHLSDRSVLGILTRRPQPESIELDPRGLAERATLHLGPLPSDAVRTLATAVGHGLDPRDVELAAGRSGGSPLFLLQYLRMLLDRPDVGELAPPDSVRLVISARLDHLAQPLRAAIQAASMVSRRITAETVAAMTGRSATEAAASINVLVRAGLLRRAGRSAGPLPAMFEFQHAVVADVAYSQLTRANRIELHRRAAAWFDALPDRSLDEVQAAGWHWQQVVELTRADRAELDPADRRAALQALVGAGRRFRHVDAGMSISFFGQAAPLADERSVEHADILLRLGEIMTNAGDFDGATTALAEAASIYDEVRQPAKAGEALARQARAAWFFGQADELDGLLDQAFTHLEKAPVSPAHAHAMVIAAAQRSLRGDAVEAIELARRAEPIVGEHGTEQDAIRLLHVSGHARFDLDDPEGVVDLEEALERSLEGGFGYLTSQTYNNLAEIVWPARGPLEAIGLAREGVELAMDCGFLGQAAWHVGQIGELSFDIGDWAGVLQAVETDLPLPPVVSWSLASLEARVAFWRGDDAAAEEVVAALDAARSTQEGQVIVSMLATVASAAALLDDEPTASAVAEELVAFAAPYAHNRLREAAEATRAMCRIGRVDLAQALVPADQPNVLRRRLMWESAKATIAEAEGRWADAANHFERAERGWAAFPHPLEAGHAAWGLARVAKQTGRNDQIAPATKLAQARFSGLGATRLESLLD